MKPPIDPFDPYITSRMVPLFHIFRDRCGCWFYKRRLHRKNGRYAGVIHQETLCSNCNQSRRRRDYSGEHNNYIFADMNTIVRVPVRGTVREFVEREREKYEATH